MGIDAFELRCWRRLLRFPWTARRPNQSVLKEISDQSFNIHWIIEKAREFQKNTYFCFIDYAKAFDCVDHNKLWKIPQEMEITTTVPAS